MARIAGVDLPRDKKVEYSLTYIYGIGLASAQKIVKEAGINPETRVTDLTSDEIAKIRNVVANDYKVEGALRTEVTMNIKRLMDIGSYRGLRHRRGLPCRGQRTHTNSRTRRSGKRLPVGGKKK